MMITFEKSPEQLIREDIERQALEAAAKALETRAGNSLYEKAWKAGAKLVRSLKPV